MSVAHTPHFPRIGVLVTSASLVAIGLATLFPASGLPVESHFCVVCGSLGGVSAVLNVFLFVPLGVGLALSGLPTRRSVLAICALSASIEVVQFFFVAGRDATIGDVLANTVGGALGFWICRRWAAWLRPNRQSARSLAAVWVTIWIAIQMISSFGFTLALPSSDYYGQIARPLPNFGVFRGKVLGSTIGDVEIPNTALPESEKVRALLLGAAPIATTVVPASRASDKAVLVRLVDGREDEVVMLAQGRRHLIFSVRTGASTLHLRPPLFALIDAFPASSPSEPFASDTLTLSGRYETGSAQMDAHSRSIDRDLQIPLSASLGWTFWLPFQWFITGGTLEHIVSWIWLGSLAIPFGYWIAEQRIPLLIGGTAIMVLGLAVIPKSFGLAATPLGDWIASLLGALLGMVLAKLVSRRMRNTSDGRQTQTADIA